MVQILVIFRVFTGLFFAEIIAENAVRLKIPEKYIWQGDTGQGQKVDWGRS